MKSLFIHTADAMSLRAKFLNDQNLIEFFEDLDREYLADEDETTGRWALDVENDWETDPELFAIVSAHNANLTIIPNAMLDDGVLPF